MSKNPVIPYILIFALGIGLIFFMSLYGLDQKKEIANKDVEGTTEEAASTEDFDAEKVAQGKCIGCHGNNFEGGAVGPRLIGTADTKEQIHDIIKNGKGAGMPAGLITNDADIDAMADYILSLK